MHPVEAGVLAAAWVLGWLLLWRLPRLPAHVDAALAVRTSVIVPARNEAARLPPLLASLADAVTDPDVEVIVVDDGSTDATATLAAAAGATVVVPPPTPPGWAGKCWACQQGAATATGALFVFLDADVWLAAGALARVRSAAVAAGGLLSVAPYHRMERAYERLSAFPNLVGAMGTAAFTVAGRRLRPRGAFGPCLALSRADYERVGGHAAVRSSTAEDVALARRAGAAGVPVAVLHGAGAVSYRMYGEGPGQLVEGWTKNLATGAAAAGVVGVLVAVWVTGCAGAAVVAARDLAGSLSGGPAPGLAAAGAAYAAFAAQLHVHLRRLGSFGVATALLYPLALSAFVVLFLRALALAALRRPVTWRGRTVPAP